MKILYCNTGWMENYDGDYKNDKPVDGGSYNKDNVGHEVNNFTCVDGIYYGYVQPPGGFNSIAIHRHFDCKKTDDYVDDVLVIWVAKRRIVGFYRNARVYRSLQQVPKKVSGKRVYDTYYITTKEAHLIPSSWREYSIDEMPRNIWYGEEKRNKDVIKYISNFEKGFKKASARMIAHINNIPKSLEGNERETLVKTRVNQSEFRTMMLVKYHNKCCICNIDIPDILIASHIKPWSKSTPKEKVNDNNGLLLCPTHDRLFDQGYIAFDPTGRIRISKRLTQKTWKTLSINDKIRIRVTNSMKPFLDYHKKNIFK